MIYVSFYGNVKNIDKNLEFYSISVGNGGYNFKKIKSFVPNWNLVQKFKSDNDWNYYVKEFDKQLENLNKKVVYDWFKERNCVLLCYEKDNKFCHRKLVMEYLKNLGLDCKEY